MRISVIAECINKDTFTKTTVTGAAAVTTVMPTPPHVGAAERNSSHVTAGTSATGTTVPSPIIAVVNVTVTAGMNFALGTMSTISTSVSTTTAVTGSKGSVGTAVVSATGGAARMVSLMVGGPTIDSKTGHRSGIML